ncbi:hypothetical protein A7982_13913 [Minicystis rosea]|nr:hypothetical protein A7982_13913 [Minicystis rosea]
MALEDAQPGWTEVIGAITLGASLRSLRSRGEGAPSRSPGETHQEG